MSSPVPDKHETPNQTAVVCIHCGTPLGICKTKRSAKSGSYKTDFHLTKPKEIDGVKYRRHACTDCFFEKYGELPSAPNVLGKNEMVFLLGVPEDVAVGIASKRGITLALMIERHGLEEGTRRFEEYRERQRETNTFEYKQKTYGWTKEQFDEYNASRAVTKENLIKRHGKVLGLEKWKQYCERQSYAGVKLEYFVEKHGKDEGERLYYDMLKSKLPTRETFVKKYGVEDGNRIFDDFSESRNAGYSMVSAEFFGLIADRGYSDDKSSIRYAPYTDEYVHIRTKYTYMLDFIDLSNNRVIEFFGDYWHMNPYKYAPEVLQTITGNSAADIWGRDYARIQTLVNDGYDIKIVWERDYRKNKDAVVQDCINFLKGNR